MRTPSRLHRHAGLLLLAAASSVAVACGDDETTTTSSASTTTPAAATTMPTTATPTTVVTATTGMGSNVESLSYLIQALLTTEQIGGGWVDQGRRVVPPGSQQLTGFLCPDGEAAVAALGGRLDAHVATTFTRPEDVGLSVSEALMWGDREQVTSDFEAFVAAVKGCAAAPYTTTELGGLTLTVDEGATFGVASLAFRFAPTTTPTDTPWAAAQTTMVLLSDPAQPVALVVLVNATTVHNPPDTTVTELEPAEYTRIVQAAVDRIVNEGL